MITPKHVYVYVYVYVPATFDASNFPELDGLHDEAHWLLHKIVTGADFDPDNTGRFVGRVLDDVEGLPGVDLQFPQPVVEVV